MEGVNLSLVALRIGQDMGDDPSLVSLADRGMPPVFEGKFDFLLGPDLLCEMRIDEPFGKEGRAKMLSPP